MNTNPSPLLKDPPPARAKRVCGICKTPGHDRRNCPHRPATLATEVAEIPVNQQNPIVTRVLPPPVRQQTPPMSPRMKWEECMYILFDLETTGGSRIGDDIIEIAAMVVGPDSVMVEDGTFQAFVRPRKQIPTFITMLTGITNEMVATAPYFSMVAEEFFDFVQTNVDAVEVITGGTYFSCLFSSSALMKHCCGPLDE